MVAAIAGASASVLFEPRIAQRLAATDVGQRMLETALKAKAAPPPAGVIVGERGGSVPEMRARDLDGRPVALPAAWAGKTTLVNVWATWCGPCLKEIPELQAFATAQGADGVQVVGIALDEDAAVRAFLQARAIGYPTLIDTPGPADAGVRLGNPAGVLPYSVLVAADGRILKTRIGPFSDAAEIAGWAATN
jgi:thiol-disulfide isomerase/thioredoxin